MFLKKEPEAKSKYILTPVHESSPSAGENHQSQAREKTHTMLNW